MTFERGQSASPSQIEVAGTSPKSELFYLEQYLERLRARVPRATTDPKIFRVELSRALLHLEEIGLAQMILPQSAIFKHYELLNGTFIYNHESAVATINGQEININATRAEALNCLLKAHVLTPGQYVPALLLAKELGFDQAAAPVDDVRVVVCRLRSDIGDKRVKINGRSQFTYIQTKPGVGYCWQPTVENAVSVR